MHTHQGLKSLILREMHFCSVAFCAAKNPVDRHHVTFKPEKQSLAMNQSA
jgi:hypothetical protein